MAGSAHAQHLDVSQDSLQLISYLNHEADAKKTSVDPHLITFDFKRKTILIENLKDYKLVYEITYTMLFQEGNPAVQLQPGETMFMGTNGEIDMVVFQEAKGSMAIATKDKRTFLFGDFDPDTDAIRSWQHDHPELEEHMRKERERKQKEEEALKAPKNRKSAN